MVSKEPEQIIQNEESVIEKIASIELKDEAEDKVVQQAVDEEGNKDSSKENELLSKESWDELGVSENIIKGLLEMNFIRPSKIQAVAYELFQKYPEKHLVAQSQNGSGKTGGFGIPTVSKIDENLNEVQAIVFAHNREMVNQTANILSKIGKYTKIKVTSIKKDSNIEKGQIMVCTPGIFQKVFIDKKSFSLNHLKVLVLDEADYLIQTDNTRVILQNIFTIINQMKETKLQVLFFSATFEKEHYKFISGFFKGKVTSIKVEKQALTLKFVKQYYIKCNNNKDEKIEEYLKANINNERIIIFVNSKVNTVALQKRLNAKGYKVFILMGGDMDPANRDETIKRFNEGKIQILITTDLLSRGYDEKLVKLIINYDLPLTKNEYDQLVPAMDTYLHRIGRTGRFGTKGIGVSLVEDKYVKNIEEIQKFYNSNIEEIKSMDDLITEFKKLLNEY